MTQHEFINGVLTELRQDGWKTTTSQLTDGVVMVKGQQANHGGKGLLALVATSAVQLSEKHVKYLLKMAHKHDVDEAVVAHENGVTADISSLCSEKGVEIIDPDRVAVTSGEDDVETGSWLDVSADSGASKKSSSTRVSRRAVVATGALALVGAVAVGASGQVSSPGTIFGGQSSSPTENRTNNQNATDATGEKSYPNGIVVTHEGDMPGKVVVKGEAKNDVGVVEISPYTDTYKTTANRTGVKIALKRTVDRNVTLDPTVKFFKDGEVYKQVNRTRHGVGKMPVGRKNTTPSGYQVQADESEIDRFTAILTVTFGFEAGK
jgi:hypothetical protein